jgi:Xaa-Pro aminopeptidase
VSGSDPAGLARARYARVQAAMERRGVGVLLLATPHLAAFASGVRRVQVAGSGGALPWVVIGAGAPAPVVFTTDPDGAPAWMPRTAVEPLRWNRDDQLARIAALIDTSRGTLACDVFAPAVRALAVERGRSLEDAAPLLAEAAWPCTARETSLVAAALAQARSAFRAAAAAVAPGATPASVVEGFASAMAPAGFPISEGRLWRSGRALERLGPQAVFTGDDLVAIEMGLYVDGYAGLVGDTVPCGAHDLSELRRRWFTALCAIAKRCRAGTGTAAVCAAASAAGAGQADLLAHGLGVGVLPPFMDLDADDDQPLRAGTVLVLSPVVDGFRATRALLVTDGAARWLEAAP